MELAEGGSLADMIKAKLVPDAEQVVATICVWLFVPGLHTLPFLHRPVQSFSNLCFALKRYTKNHARPSRV